MGGLMAVLSPTHAHAQSITLAQALPPPSEVIRPRQETLPEAEPLPEDEPDFFPSPPPQPELPPDSTPTQEGLPQLDYQVNTIQIENNTVFTDDVLLENAVSTVLPLSELSEDNPFLTVTLQDLLLAANEITQYYIDEGYTTTGAILIGQRSPETQRIEVAPNGVVTFQVIEGSIEAIEVLGTERLNPDYVRSRLALATGTPLNVDHLITALQLLHNDPLIDAVDAVLGAGSSIGTNVLQISVQEADSFQVTGTTDNSRSPNVGQGQWGVHLAEGNLLGFGDRATASYTSTEGSNGVALSYAMPLNPREGTLSFSYNHVSSQIIEPTVEILGIESTSDYLDITWRQPLVRTPFQEFALSLTGSYRQNRTVFGEDLFGFPVGFPTGDGRSQVTAIRFAQDWISRDQVQAFAMRSQFSLGLNAQEPGVDGPIMTQFLSWRGLAQYRRQLGPDFFLLARGDMQLANRALVPLEQFSLGGVGTVRGYRQGLLLADNGVLGSVELWVPVLRAPEVNGLLQVVPFVDMGTAWNSDGTALSQRGLASVGLGLRWQQDYLSAQLDWGMPLIAGEGNRGAWAGNGLHFSISITGL